MFSTMLKSALVAASLSLGAVAATTAPAAAGDGYIQFDAPGISVGFGQRRHYRDHGRRIYDHGGYDDRRYRRGRCTPRRAVRKARRNGIRRAHVVRAGRRGVVVAGRQWGRACGDRLWP